jgi:hypothetical protein
LTEATKCCDDCSITTWEPTDLEKAQQIARILKDLESIEVASVGTAEVNLAEALNKLGRKINEAA